MSILKRPVKRNENIKQWREIYQEFSFVKDKKELETQIKILLECYEPKYHEKERIKYEIQYYSKSKYSSDHNKFIRIVDNHSFVALCEHFQHLPEEEKSEQLSYYLEISEYTLHLMCILYKIDPDDKYIQCIEEKIKRVYCLIEYLKKIKELFC